MNTIVIVKRPSDYMAFLKASPGVWGCGKGPNEAIGDMIQAHAKHFNLQIEL